MSIINSQLSISVLARLDSVLLELHVAGEVTDYLAGVLVHLARREEETVDAGDEVSGELLCLLSTCGLETETEVAEAVKLNYVGVLELILHLVNESLDAGEDVGDVERTLLLDTLGEFLSVDSVDLHGTCVVLFRTSRAIVLVQVVKQCHNRIWLLKRLCREKYFQFNL